MSAQPIRVALRRVYVEIETVDGKDYYISCVYEDVEDAKAAVAAGRQLYEYGYIGQYKGTNAA